MYVVYVPLEQRDPSHKHYQLQVGTIWGCLAPAYGGPPHLSMRESLVSQGWLGGGSLVIVGSGCTKPNTPTSSARDVMCITPGGMRHTFARMPRSPGHSRKCMSHSSTKCMAGPRRADFGPLVHVPSQRECIYYYCRLQIDSLLMQPRRDFDDSTKWQ